MKYELLMNYWSSLGVIKIRQIIAVRDFYNPHLGLIRAGTVGGWVESENNLSQEGGCWIADDAKVIGLAKVLSNATMINKSRAQDDARISGNALVCDESDIWGRAIIYGNAKIFGKSEIYDHARVHGETYITDAHIYEHSHVFGNASLTGKIIVKGFARIYGFTTLRSSDHAIHVYGTVKVCGTTSICLPPQAIFLYEKKRVVDEIYAEYPCEVPF